MRSTTLRSPVAAYAFLALGAGLIGVHFVLPANQLPQAVTSWIVGFLSFLVVVGGILLHRPERTIHLWLLAAGLGLLSLGDAIWSLYGYVLAPLDPSFSSVAEWVHLSGYAGIVAAFLFLVRSRQRPNLSDLLDGLIVLSGGAVLIWFALMEPVASDGSMSVAGRVLSTAYPTADLLLLVALAQLVVTAGARGFAYRAILLGAAVLFVTDVLYGLETLDGTYVEGGWLDGGWMVAAILWGAAVLHPSIRGLHEHARLRGATLTWTRLGLLAGAALVTPFVIVLYHEGGVLDTILIASAAAVTTLLIFVRMTMLFRDHGRAVVALRDVQARREAEEMLTAANERFQSAARALECVIYEWIPDRDEIRWSEGLAAAFGHPASLVDAPNSWFLDHVHPDDRLAVSATLGHVRAGQTSGQSTYRFQAGDGSYRHVLDRWIVRKNEDGSVAGVIGGMVDVTEGKELERQLRQAQKMEAVGRLAGGIAHDFNNLLLAIAGNAELLAGSPTLAADEQYEVAQILQATGRAAELTRQLLAFSRNQVDGPAAVELNEGVRAAESMLRRLLGSDIEVVTELGDGVGWVPCDALGVEQIVVNLAVNARDAMPAGGLLRISTWHDDDASVLIVEDTGAGMDPVTASRVFEPFFTTKEVGKGTGLGLATVYGIVERAGGSIDVASELSVGTSFRIRLPRVQASPGGEPSSLQAGSHGSESILLVEDEPAVRSLVGRMLAAHGYDVVESPDPAHALERFADETFMPDLVVTDLVMPGMGGGALAERLTELRPGLRVLFISGYSGGADWDSPHALLPKPFTAAELTGAVRQALKAAPARAAVA